MSNHAWNSPIFSSLFFVVTLSSSPGGGRPIFYGTSLFRADATARLNSPIPSQPFGTPPVAQASTPTPRSTGWQGSESLTPLPGAGTTAVGPGVSALAAALSNPFAGSPPRFGAPP